MKNTLTLKHVALAAALAAVCGASFAQSNQNEEFPDLDKSYLKTGSFVGIDHVRRVELGAVKGLSQSNANANLAMRMSSAGKTDKADWPQGMTKDQVRLELSHPHFSEGIGNNKVWNYAFNFYTGAASGQPNSGQYVTCQFKVRFNDDDRVESTHWRDAACAQYTQPVVAKAMPIAAFVPPPTARPAQRLTLGADGLFAFNKAGMADLQPKGQRNLEDLAAQLKTSFKSVSSLMILGHTDRIGSDAANMKLSQERANTVKDFLASRGVDNRVMRAVGMGSTQPTAATANCGNNMKTAAAKASLASCLQADRRVEVEVVGES